MFKIKSRSFAFLLLGLFIISMSTTNAYINEKIKKENEKTQVERNYGEVFDQQSNAISNLQFPVINNGKLFYDNINGLGAGIWPRGSQNEYIFGGGIWFGAQKKIVVDSVDDAGHSVVDEFGDTIKIEEVRKLVELTYNPSSAESWMVPGRIDASDKLESDEITKYRVYFSTDFLKTNGKPLNKDHGESWPVWDTLEDEYIKYERYFGYYIDDTERNMNIFPKGPAFISGEDIFCTYKDTDLSYYEGGVRFRRNQGYPMRLQFEQMIYSWGFGRYKDFIFVKYDIISRAEDTLYNCWMTPIMDVDIALMSRQNAGANNDRVRYFEEEDSLNLAFQWTDIAASTTANERDKGFGYLGFDFLESPAVYTCEQPIDRVDTVVVGEDTTYVHWCRMYIGDNAYWQVQRDEEGNVVRDSDGFIVWDWFPDKSDSIEFPETELRFVRKDKRVYTNPYQIGLTTFVNWARDEDFKEDVERYDFMASERMDGDQGFGDKRFMMSTGPFHMRPNDTVRVVVGILIAPGVNADSDGSVEDVKPLVDLDKFAQEVYDNNFQAPLPPWESKIYIKEGLNNAVRFTWDSTAETTVDRFENGLDFLGYRIYRARNTNLDTFAINNEESSVQYSRGRGPFGWKQIAQYQMPVPFWKSAKNQFSRLVQNLPLNDSLQVIGPWYNDDGTIDPMSIRVIRIPRGIIVTSNDTAETNTLVSPQEYYTRYHWMKKLDKELLTECYVTPLIVGVDTSYYVKPWGPYWKSMLEKEDVELPTTKLPIMINPEEMDINHSFLVDSIMIGRIELNEALLAYNPLLWRNEVCTATFTEHEVDSLRQHGVWLDQSNEAYLWDTYRTEYVNNNANTFINKMTPIDSLGAALYNSKYLAYVLDSVYTYLQDGRAKAHFREYEDFPNIKDSVIIPYMRRITNNFTFYDTGDDDRSGVIETNIEVEKTELLLNNVDYHYRILAYDEGDYVQFTPPKNNSSDEMLGNEVVITPRKDPISDRLKFEIIDIDSTKLGSFHNFQFYTVNEEKARQLFAGHVLKLEILPHWNLSEAAVGRTGNSSELIEMEFGMYWRRLRLTDTTTGDVLYEIVIQLEADLCRIIYQGAFTEDAASYVFSTVTYDDEVTGEPITFMNPDCFEKERRGGSFSTGDFQTQNNCYHTMGNMFAHAYGTLGFSFDYVLDQYSGKLRPTEMIEYPTGETSAGVFPAVVAANDLVNVYSMNLRTTLVGDFERQKYFSFSKYPESLEDYHTYDTLRAVTDEIFCSFNNGPGIFEVEFYGGGTEKIEVAYGEETVQTKEFDVPYLNVRVRNIKKDTAERSDGTEMIIKYPNEIEYMALPDEWIVPKDQEEGYDVVRKKAYIPSPVGLGTDASKFTNKFNIHCYGWINSRYEDGASALKEMTARKHGPGFDNSRTAYLAQGSNEARYYLSAQSGSDVLDMVNMINIGGMCWVFDYAAHGRRHAEGLKEWKNRIDDDDKYKTDFKDGDKIILKSWGGVFGLPEPETSILVKLSDPYVKDNDIEDSDLDKIYITPNPYYMTHQNQASPFDAKIYFNRLPEKCTIDIYTIAGDKVKSINHDHSVVGTDEISMDIWDIMSRNNLRATSQVLLAVITTPNGAQTVKKFSIVVGGFRKIEEEEG